MADDDRYPVANDENLADGQERPGNRNRLPPCSGDGSGARNKQGNSHQDIPDDPAPSGGKAFPEQLPGIHHQEKSQEGHGHQSVTEYKGRNSQVGFGRARP